MTDPRHRYSGRRSPTFNPARASMPVSVGHNPHFSGDLHTVQTARYDATAPRRANDHKASGSNPTTTITTYNVTKDPAPRTSNTARRRSSTVDSAAVKPIIITTSHARPHGSSSHTTSSSAARQASPSRDPYRSSDETYYTQPASSTRGRSQHRYGHGYSQSATLSNDELKRLREQVGDDRLRAPLHTATDYYRYPLTHATYTNPPHDLGTAVIDYENEGYEYTKPSDLARYDLDHDRQQPRRSRRDSFDRPNYYRPTVNVVSNDPGRYDGGRGRAPPPTSIGLDRYNRAAAAGIYNRPTVTMPILPPPVPAPPPVDPLRRIEAPRLEPPRDASPDRRIGRPRPVSLYQDAPARISHADDVYRSHDDERLLHTRRHDYRGVDDEVSARGFGIRTNTIPNTNTNTVTDSLKPEQITLPERPARSVDRRDYDDRRVRRDAAAAEREPRRRSDESIDYTRSHDSRKPVVDDGKDALSRKNSIGGRARDKVAAGLGVAAAAMGLVPKDNTTTTTAAAAKDDDRKVSPRRRDTIDDEEGAGAGASRAAERYRPREKDVVERVERRTSPRDDIGVGVERRESRRERADSTSASRDRELERERVRERAQERERERERGKERDRHEVDEAERERVRERAYERERERERDRDRDQRDADKDRELDARERARRDTESILNGTTVVDSRDISPASDGAVGTSRRRRRNSSTFDPTDPRDLLDVKAELAAKDGQEKPKDKPVGKEPASEKETSASTSVERQSESREESRGRELATSQEKEKTVRVLSPPREKPEPKPIKGILKPPSAKFPEEENPIREGVAPHKDDKSKKGVPPGARWTKINRKLINPAALEIGKERFEVRDDFVIVLRVLSKEEIQAYATATAQIRAQKRREYEKEFGTERDYDRDHDRSDEERRTRRHRRDYDDDYEYRRDRDRDDDRERHRRHRHASDSDDEGRPRRAIEYDTASSSRHHRSHRDRDYDSLTVNSDERR
ncbi:hypothetical protein M434DRAFT_13222 [Hypoxylon sp. CO27-5]|nr:hypothetical protein M434DRAFT_13222 [Hypoxylon sp. CO27-5]